MRSYSKFDPALHLLEKKKTFHSTMQAHQTTLKKYGHNRRPSYGSKMMPISSILLDLSGESPRHFESISKDGISPENDVHPIVFSFDGVKLSSNASNSFVNLLNDRIQTATTNFIEHESKNSIPPSNDNDKNGSHEVDFNKTFLKCVRYHYDNNENDKKDIADIADSNGINLAGDDKNNDKPCLVCTNNVANSIAANNNDKQIEVLNEIKKSDDQQPLVELCQVLCDESCKKNRKMSKEFSSVEPVSLSTTSTAEAFSASTTSTAEAISTPASSTAEAVSTSATSIADAISTPATSSAEVVSTSATSTAEAISQPATSSADSKSGILARQNSSRQEFLASMLTVDRRVSDTPFVKPTIITNPENGELQPNAEHSLKIVPLTIENLKEFDENYFRDKLAVAEALAQASMMTSPAVKRRLAARKLEMEINDGDFAYDSDTEEFIPPKQLLMYLVRY